MLTKVEASDLQSAIDSLIGIAEEQAKAEQRMNDARRKLNNLMWKLEHDEESK